MASKTKAQDAKAAAIAKKRAFAAKVRGFRAQVKASEITTGEAMQAREDLLARG